jgi:hypothetical protein
MHLAEQNQQQPTRSRTNVVSFPSEKLVEQVMSLQSSLWQNQQRRSQQVGSTSHVALVFAI